MYDDPFEEHKNNPLFLILGLIVIVSFIGTVVSKSIEQEKERLKQPIEKQINSKYSKQ